MYSNFSKDELHLIKTLRHLTADAIIIDLQWSATYNHARSALSNISAGDAKSAEDRLQEAYPILKWFSENYGARLYA